MYLKKELNKKALVLHIVRFELVHHYYILEEKPEVKRKQTEGSKSQIHCNDNKVESEADPG